VPILVVLFSPEARITGCTILAALLSLGTLGALSAAVGGACRWRGAVRMLVWGSLAMGLTAAVGRLFGTVV
jgi:VIT1/CCC1 family predicted Fe2+/Mn2+ transporter